MVTDTVDVLLELFPDVLVDSLFSLPFLNLGLEIPASASVASAVQVTVRLGVFLDIVQSVPYV
jgi:hypothetical protein